jgi:hypothetical protein
MNETLKQFIKVEHYRWHCAEEWADSPYKEAVLRAIHSALNRLEAAAVEPVDPPACIICAARKKQAKVLMFPSRPETSPVVLRPAA